MLGKLLGLGCLVMGVIMLISGSSTGNEHRIIEGMLFIILGRPYDAGY